MTVTRLRSIRRSFLARLAAIVAARCRIDYEPRPASAACPVCSGDHDPRHPHDATAILYRARFVASHGREPTWADAAAHCTADDAAEWRDALAHTGYSWSEPPVVVEPVGVARAVTPPAVVLVVAAARRGDGRR
jgi:hypothetical protein